MHHDWRIACEANVEQAGDEGSCRGMKRKGKKACGEGDGRWRRLYSFTRSFIVRTHRLGGLQSLWLIQNSRHDRRVYVYVFFFFFVPSSCPCTLALVVVVVHRHRHRHRRGNPLLVVFVLLLAVDWWLVSERREQRWIDIDSIYRGREGDWKGEREEQNVCELTLQPEAEATSGERREGGVLPQYSGERDSFIMSSSAPPLMHP